MNNKIRLQKFLSSQNIGSRRAIEQLITEGRIKVNGKLAILGTKVDENDKITVNNKVVNYKKEENIVILFNKPKNVLVTKKDPGGRETIYGYLPEKYQHLKYAGRLDYDSEGLLLLTNDGDLIQKLTHPGFKVKKVYEAQLDSSITPAMQKRLTTNINLKDGPGKFVGINKIGRNKYEVAVEEGRNRFVRRMFEYFGANTLNLKRVQFGKYKLHLLKPGKIKLVKN